MVPATVPGVDVDIRDDVGWITINAPQRRNALTLAMTRSIAEQTSALAGQDAIRAVVITGVGTAFSAGSDLDDTSDGHERASAYVDVYTAMTLAPKPVICRVNGHTYGGALGIVASSDLSVMSVDSTFGLLEPRMGLVATSAAVPLLRRLQHTDAAEILLSGRRFSAEHAAAIGLVTTCVPANALDATVADFIADIRECGPEALRECKRLLWASVSLDEWARRQIVALTAVVEAGDESRSGRHARRAGHSPPWSSSATTTDPA
jgi:enoyl-CoA hydratase/carnithine racemase